MGTYSIFPRQFNNSDELDGVNDLPFAKEILHSTFK